MKTTLSPESQHDSAGPRPSQNLLLLMFFEVSNLNGPSAPSFSDFLSIFSDFGHPSRHLFFFGFFGYPKKHAKPGPAEPPKTEYGGSPLDLRSATFLFENIGLGSF